MRIFIKNNSLNSTITIEVAQDDKIINLKIKIHDKVDIPPEQQCLIFHGRKLDDEKTIADCNIVKETTIYLVLASTESFDLTIKRLNDGDFKINVKSKDSIIDLKAKIEDKINVPPERQHLLLAGTSLDDNSKTLEDYNIQNDSVINLILTATDFITISIKELNVGEFTVEINPNETIKDIKTKIKTQKGYPIKQQKLVYESQLLTDSKNLADYDIKNDALIFLMYIMETEVEDVFSEDGGTLNSQFIELVIPRGLLNNETNFSIKKFNQELKCPHNINKSTHIFELQPHLQNFDLPITVRFTKIESQSGNICLFKQENDDIDKALDKWSCHFPKKRQNKIIEYELKTFGNIFLAKIEMGIGGIDYKFPTVTQFNNLFKPHQYNSPGLNYLINCDKDDCPDKQELMVFKKGFGIFQPQNDVDLETMNCILCNEPISDIECIKLIILHKSKGSIQFRLNTDDAKLQKKNFDLDENELVLFGDDQMRDTYSSLIINVENN